MSPPIAGEWGSKTIPDWTFLIAFSFFRIIAIHQGVYKRSLDGNASNPERARQYGKAVPMMARLAMEAVEERASDSAAIGAPCERRRAMLSGRRPLRRDFTSSSAPERWQSGRSRRTRNAEYVQAYRGFESLPLRQLVI